MQNRLIPIGAATLVLVAVVLSMFGPAPHAAAPWRFDPYPAVEPAPHGRYHESLPGSKIRFEMVAIPGGKYMMGSHASEPGRRDDEGPRHPVHVGAFWMGKLEVTWDEYDLFRKGDALNQSANEAALADNADAVTRPTPPYPDETRGMGREGFPVIGITHHAAMEYCHWLSRQTGKHYRLPTEAEWEWACRAGTRSAYFFGDDPARLGDFAWFGGNADERTHPVGKKQPNPWGLHDIYGNASEWCLDHFQKNDYGAYPCDRLTFLPVRLPTAARFAHVVRGGNADNAAGRCRSAARTGSNPNWNRIDPEKNKSVWWLWNEDFVGFRVVRAVDELPSLRALRSKVIKESK